MPVSNPTKLYKDVISLHSGSAEGLLRDLHRLSCALPSLVLSSLLLQTTDAVSITHFSKGAFNEDFE